MSSLHLVTGKVDDRNTPMGELVSILRAVTDAIAWSSFPPTVFWSLFRADGPLAELFRNFILAQRILRAFGLHAVSRPALPTTHAHHLWDVWDTTLELFLLHLGSASPEAPRSWDFFGEQMAAFCVWLRFPPSLSETSEPAVTLSHAVAGLNWGYKQMNDRGRTSSSTESSCQLPDPPVELAVVFHMLLRSDCRMQALELFASFVDLGPWAVHFTMLVGAKPILAKLLSHDDQELVPEVAPLALVVWTKLLVFDGSGLLAKDTYRSFFFLARSQHLQSHARAFALLCLAIACRNQPAAKKGAVKLGVLDLLSKLLISCVGQPMVRWMALVLCAEVCKDHREAASAVLQGTMLRSLLAALEDPAPEVRAGAACAIGRILASDPPMAVTDDEEPEPLVSNARPGFRHSGDLSDKFSTRCHEDPVSDGSSDTTVRLRRMGPVIPQSSNWLGLAHAMMWHFVREPHSEARNKSDATNVPHCSLLNEASMLVRYELVCALSPWLGHLACDRVNMPPPASDMESHGSDEVDDVVSVCSTPSGPSTPTLHPVRSPHMLPNSSLSAVPVAAAHQAERRFMNLLGQAPLLPLIGDLPVANPVSLRGTWTQGRSDVGSMNRIHPESVIYEWTISYLQQPKALASLEEHASSSYAPPPPPEPPRSAQVVPPRPRTEPARGVEPSVKRQSAHALPRVENALERTSSTGSGPCAGAGCARQNTARVTRTCDLGMHTRAPQVLDSAPPLATPAKLCRRLFAGAGAWRDRGVREVQAFFQPSSTSSSSQCQVPFGLARG